MGQQYRTLASRDDGVWSVCLDTHRVLGGPYPVRISSGGEEVVLGNVRVGLVASSCHNDRWNVQDGPYPCPGGGQSEYPQRWFNRAVAYWGFKACDSNSEPSTLAPQRSRATGFCLPSGIFGEGWRFEPSQFLRAETVAGLAAGNTAHSVALWLQVHNVSSSHVPLLSLGARYSPSFASSFSPGPPSPFDHTAAFLPSPHTLPLDQPGTFAGSRAGGSSGGSSGSSGGTSSGEGRFVLLRASTDLCGHVPRLPGSSWLGPQPALVLGVQGHNASEVFWRCVGLRLQAGVWYHVGWSYDGGEPSGVLRLFVNGELWRAITLNGTLLLGDHPRPGRPDRVSMMAGRDPVTRAPVASWALDELFLLRGALDAQVRRP